MRALVVSDRLLVKLDPANRFMMTGSSTTIPIVNITGMTISSGPDPVVVLHLRDGSDTVFYIMNGNYAAELMALLVQLLFREVNGREGRGGGGGGSVCNLTIAIPTMLMCFFLCVFLFCLPEQCKTVLKVNVMSNITFMQNKKQKTLTVMHSMDSPEVLFKSDKSGAVTLCIPTTTPE
jgi:hypothetical protein